MKHKTGATLTPMKELPAGSYFFTTATPQEATGFAKAWKVKITTEVVFVITDLKENVKADRITKVTILQDVSGGAYP